MANEGRKKAAGVKAWLNSPEGYNASVGIAQGQYLENRLWRAYMAGWDTAVASLSTKRAGRGKRGN